MTVDEEIIVDVSLHGIANEYRIFFENLTFLSFSKLIEAAKRKMNLLEGRHDQALESSQPDSEAIS